MGCHHLLLLKVGHGCVGNIKVYVNTTNQDLKYHRLKVNYQKNSVHLASLLWRKITSSHRLKTSGTTYFTLISIGHYKNSCRNIGFKGWLHIFICCFWLSAYSTWNPQVKPIKKIICNIQGYNIYIALILNLVSEITKHVYTWYTKHETSSHSLWRHCNAIS